MYLKVYSCYILVKGCAFYLFVTLCLKTQNPSPDSSGNPFYCFENCPSPETSGALRVTNNKKIGTYSGIKLQIKKRQITLTLKYSKK